MIRIIAIGKRHEPWIVDGVKRYTERLRAPWNIEWVLLPHSQQNGLSARQEESQAILSRLNARDTVILLDERGKMWDSPALSREISSGFEQSKQLVIIIGGAYGVDESLVQRADRVWSLSPLVFPHQLVRLILTEQLYRAQAIAGNHPYHHE